MALVGYARVSSVGQSLEVQLEKLKGCNKVFKEKRSGVDTGRPALKQCLEFLRDGLDTTSRTGKLIMGILALIAEFENDIRRERQIDGIAKAKDRGVKFGRKRELTDDRVEEIRALRQSGETVPAIIKRTGFSKASVYRALNA